MRQPTCAHTRTVNARAREPHRPRPCRPLPHRAPSPSQFGGGGSWYFTHVAGLGRARGSRGWSTLEIAPVPVTPALTWASASVSTPIGFASSSWTAAPAGICGYGAENANIDMTCTGGVFSSVVFASFGTPSGSCPNYTASPACNSPNSVAVVTAACVGKASCTIPATNAAFGGDPCVNTVKALAVVLAGNCKVPTLTQNVIIPANAGATIAVPTGGPPTASTTIVEGATTVWANGAFVPGTPGVTAGVATPTGVVFTVGSGSYALHTYA